MTTTRHIKGKAKSVRTKQHFLPRDPSCSSERLHRSRQCEPRGEDDSTAGVWTLRKTQSILNYYN